jgi:hypothetical protein
MIKYVENLPKMKKFSHAASEKNEQTVKKEPLKHHKINRKPKALKGR